MATGIGTTLREARSRRQLDLTEVEAATKIRVRYLRAIENEEWDALPGGAYTRGFIRAYASYLGLDAERLADDYRHGVEPPRQRIERPPRVRRSRSRLSSPLWIAVVCTALIGALVAIGLTSGGESGRSVRAGGGAKAHRRPQRTTAVAPAAQGVAVSLQAKAEVWVCLLDGSGKRLIDGEILAAGAERGPFHSRRFTVSLGNGEVTLLVDGQSARIPATSSPVGFEIRSGGRLSQLSEAERPTCT